MAITKTGIEKNGKAIEMNRITNALLEAGLLVENVNDAGTLAYMITDGDLEGRFITIKVVLTKEYNEETGTGFDFDDAHNEYILKMEAQNERIRAKAEKDKIKADKEIARLKKIAEAK